MPRWGYGEYYFAQPLAFLSGARDRIGFAEQCSNPASGKVPTDRLLTRVLHHKEPRHEARRSLDMLEYLGGTVQEESLDLWLTTREQEEARQRLAGLRVGPDEFAHYPDAGCLKTEKQWPVNRFGELGAWLHQDVWGAPPGGGRARRRALGPDPGPDPGGRGHQPGGADALRQTAALISQSQLFVGNDSGPIHLAAAGGVPVVEISSFPHLGHPLHPRSPARFGPWGVPHRILQPAGPTPPCTEACLAAEPHCILEVTMAQVQGAVAELLAATCKNPRVYRKAGVTA